jgi:peptidyl-tRNA hydrolase
MHDAKGKLAAQVSHSTVTLALHDGGADLFISKARLLQAKISNISLGKF